MPAPISDADVSSLTHLVLWLAFAWAALFGALAQRSHFCTMGAIADVVASGDWTRARMFALALGVVLAGFGTLAGGGWIDPAQAFYTAPRLAWGSALVGGALFGCGMVLSSGCGAKTLVRIGGGNLKSLVVFIVMGVAALATLRGITAVARSLTVDRLAIELLPRQDAAAQWAAHGGVSRPAASLILGWGLGLPCMALALLPRSAERRSILWGAGVGLLLTAMWWTSGHLGFVAEHPQTLEPAFLGSASHGMEAFSFVSPAAYLLDWLTYFSDAGKLLSFGVVLPLGVVAGSAAVALAGGSFRWEGFGGPADLGRHLVGALLMGVGGVTALGCSIGQGLSGLSTLAPASLLATLAIIAGAVATLRWQVWRLERMA